MAAEENDKPADAKASSEEQKKPTFVEIAKADAAKLFGRLEIMVQTAESIVVKGDDGKKRQAFKTTDVPLAAAHITGAKKYSDGRAVITTTDGKKYELATK